MNHRLRPPVRPYTYAGVYVSVTPTMKYMLFLMHQKYFCIHKLLCMYICMEPEDEVPYLPMKKNVTITIWLPWSLFFLYFNFFTILWYLPIGLYDWHARASRYQTICPLPPPPPAFCPHAICPRAFAT